MPTMQLAFALIGSFTQEEIIAGIVRMGVGILIALLMHLYVRALPWPRPLRPGFVLLHLAALPVWGLLWAVVASAVEGVIRGTALMTTAERGWEEFIVFGLFLYFVVAGVSYPVQAAARAARAEAAAARMQLAAMRAQLHPHFLFNALHAVVQLIPIDPARAVEAAELVASLLRTTIEEDRHEVTLADEWAFVARYLEVEQIRFGDRLRVRREMDDALLEERIPSFSLQTLVENAVRHGAAHRVAPTEVVVTAAATPSRLTLSVWNTGDPAAGDTAANGASPDGAGTGLARLRERLAVLYGDAARLSAGAGGEGGYEAVLVVPRGGSAS